jgi:hypothetical protein
MVAVAADFTVAADFPEADARTAAGRLRADRIAVVDRIVPPRRATLAALPDDRAVTRIVQDLAPIPIGRQLAARVVPRKSLATANGTPLVRVRA